MIRDAVPKDFPAIRALARHCFPGGEEARLIERLRANGDALVELVAASDIAIYGHILYSRLAIERGSETLEAAALAPVCVLPAFKNRGAGGRLIEAGNARCREQGLVAVLVLGHADYYPRFGFSAKIAESLEGPFAGPHFMALELQPGVLAKGGRVVYPEPFGV